MFAYFFATYELKPFFALGACTLILDVRKAVSLQSVLNANKRLAGVGPNYGLV